MTKNLLLKLSPGGKLRQSVVLKFACAPGAAVAGYAIQAALLPRPGIAPFVFFYFTIALAAWLGGRSVGLLGVVLSAGTAKFAFMEPAHAWSLGREHLIATALFIISSGAVALLCGTLRMSTLRAQDAAKQLNESERSYHRLFTSMQEGLAHCEIELEGDQPCDFRYIRVNAAFTKLTGLKDVAGKRVTELIPGIREADPELFAKYGRVAQSGNPEHFEMFVKSMNMWFDISVYSPARNQFVAVFDVITERKLLEEQLRQSQKMEAIGRLAGGIAHDFNNLLTGIGGNLSLALVDLERDHPIVEMLNEANRATLSAADLTRQLLAFSRKQVVEPRVIDLNEAIDALQKMLARVIGEDIALTSRLAQCVAPIRIDPGQLEQVLLNLAVNARDAMPAGGRLTIETASVILDEHYCAAHPEVSPGAYVMLAVSDDGCGMSEDVRQRCFEPFFTSKDRDRGTGLGLLTVYGILKQSGGLIEAYSEIGRGTTFKIHLPRATETPEPFVRNASVQELPPGSETIVVVEDDLVVRNVAVRLLRKLGYNVLPFSRPVDAVSAIAQYSGNIHLLLTDVVMPQMNGRQLSEELRVMRPNLKVLFTSGYTENVIVHHGVLDSGIYFIGKPYAAQGLATKVREVLDESSQCG